MLRAVLFDLDGVLVKSEETWLRLLEEAGQRYRGRPVTREEFLPTFGQGTEADVRSFGFACTSAELDRFYLANFSRCARSALWVNPEAGPLLTALAARGLALAVCTNTMTPLADEILRAAHMREPFQVVACADQVARPKPAPDLVLHACSRLGVSPSEAWLVGDSRFDRGAARDANVHFVGLGLDGDVRIEQLSEVEALASAR